jgi:hypothetical protein
VQHLAQMRQREFNYFIGRYTSCSLKITIFRDALKGFHHLMKSLSVLEELFITFGQCKQFLKKRYHLLMRDLS